MKNLAQDFIDNIQRCFKWYNKTFLPLSKKMFVVFLPFLCCQFSCDVMAAMLECNMTSTAIQRIYFVWMYLPSNREIRENTRWIAKACFSGLPMMKSRLFDLFICCTVNHALLIVCYVYIVFFCFVLGTPLLQFISVVSPCL